MNVPSMRAIVSQKTLNFIQIDSVYLCALVANANAHEFVGTVRVVDDDTAMTGPTRIRLEGIDTPETDQICLDTSGERWACRHRGSRGFAEHVGVHQVSCASPSQRPARCGTPPSKAPIRRLSG